MGGPERALPPEVADRSERTLWLLHATFVYLRLGRIAEARRFAREHEALATRLSPHHHVHAVGATLLTRTVVGRWDEASAPRRGRRGRVRGQRRDAVRHELALAAHGGAGRGAAGRRAGGPAARGVRRRDRAAATRRSHRSPRSCGCSCSAATSTAAREALDADPGPYPWTDVDYAPARLDGLAAVGDRAGVEAEAPPLLRAGGYGEPFALRALGLVRGDRALHRAGGGPLRGDGPRLARGARRGRCGRRSAWPDAPPRCTSICSSAASST